MRIIGGEWRGRKIEEPRGRDVTRPTTDRVREACASMVMSAFDFDLDEVRVLDAFGGSGALGLEMLSRGARSLTTFEIERNAARLITKNIESLCRDRARWRVVTGDMLASASRGRVPGGPFDLVLLDPPYAFGAEPVEILLQNLAQQGLLAPGAYALFEHAAADAGAHPAGFEIVREKRYGITSVDLLRWVGDDDGEEDCTGTDAHNNDAMTVQENAHE
ncbi:16S rRNA (guanine(966)-N(2))-methyltransferase RsmD [Collinsella aerofaciens]|uniref:16S rRNA (guanine(966)-N(2))-methyltransferase RsmD n=1 Tax=Collinsella aerofaciens TaxID=74426 RepID=UPI00232DF72A|nr:16S rRNA (guanine(966)-N(2))-methyltransferase RsmD [Collinsella aerofaciens]MDB1817816.1 16S rRNA (guanine(966)-N(2))-methyltransferase RsmD [Collinsella aerofaciens]MDB1821555.1 16S rRNA (guanine(966)-N(2))-methyltransferase RsmD [Collinsella aerofaciens]MDB1823401.1 16S rRNA (guanine(966)-N(2))-methyltransferase RsmD [Collinsella aerofaciens]MDB1825211.1 16S rRNA (guanine(966)-N(2))-methyltransferase RsmD [Collinsella aerofaciens]MDC0805478.1 16S rRNA (guanine(966)-N(2))-methyltransferas